VVGILYSIFKLVTVGRRLGTLDYKFHLILYRIAVAVRQLLTAPDSRTERWLRNLKLLGVIGNQPQAKQAVWVSERLLPGRSKERLLPCSSTVTDDEKIPIVAEGVQVWDMLTAG